MRFPIPEDTSLEDRIRLFEKYMDDEYGRIDAELDETQLGFDTRTRLKTERAEIDATRWTFKRLFERELKS